MYEPCTAVFIPLGITAATGKDCVYGSSWTPFTIWTFKFELSDAWDVIPAAIGLTDNTLAASMKRAVGAVWGTKERFCS